MNGKTEKMTKKQILEVLEKYSFEQEVDVTSAPWKLIESESFSKVADEILLLSKPKKGKKDFTPPTIQEVMSFFKENGYQEQKGADVWKYYNDGDWTDRNQDPVKNWKQKIRANWFRDEFKVINNSQSQMIR